MCGFDDAAVKGLIVFAALPTLYIGLWAFARLVVNKLPRPIVSDP